MMVIQWEMQPLTRKTVIMPPVKLDIIGFGGIVLATGPT